MNLVTTPGRGPPDDGPGGGASGAVPAVKALRASTTALRASTTTQQSEEAPRGGSQPWTAAEYQVTVG